MVTSLIGRVEVVAGDAHLGCIVHRMLVLVQLRVLVVRLSSKLRGDETRLLSLRLLRLCKLVIVHWIVPSLESLTDLLWRLILGRVRHLPLTLLLKLIVRHCLWSMLSTLVLMELLIVLLVKSLCVTTSILRGILQVAAVILTLIVVRVLPIVIVIVW